MATRSTIAVQHQDGTVSQIYAHWDGYLEHNGSLLKTHYTTLELAEELVSLGDISSLNERIHPTAPLGIGHSFDQPEKGVTVYYGRDRGESDIAPAKYANLSDYMENGGGQEYDYIFLSGEWFVSCWATNETDTGYVTLAKAAELEKNLEEE